MTDSALEKIKQLDREIENDQAERDRLKEQSDRSLERLHRLTRELEEVEPNGARPAR
jgi:phage shock protein A